MCDGVWHCVFGDDEVSCTNFCCDGLFKCSKCDFKACIHSAEVCDNAIDCCSREDEYFCQFQCPYSCKCLMYALHCSSSFYELISEFITTDKIYIEFIMTKLNQISYYLAILNNSTLVLKWTQSNLHNLCNILKVKSTNVQYLDFSFNHLYEIKRNCFLLHKNVQLLLLSNNKIANIDTQAFAGLQSLLKLDLSFNSLKKFSTYMLMKIKIYIFNISQNNFKEIYADIKVLEIDMVSTDDYRICCVLHESKTVCLRKPKWPQNCNLMLNTKVSEALSIVLGIMIFSFNSITFIFSLLSKRDSLTQKSSYKKHILPSFTLITLCLYVNDLLVGIYLIAIFFVGKYYDKNYVIHAEEWLNSFYCIFLGFITSFEMLYSLFLLTLISLSRFVAVKYPFSCHFKKVHLTIRYLCTGFLANSLICLGIYFLYYTVEEKCEMPSSICLLLGVTLNSKTIKGFTIVIAIL